MGLIDVIMTIGITGAAFFTGFCVRGLFAENETAESPVIDRPSGFYEPPRRNERI